MTPEQREALVERMAVTVWERREGRFMPRVRRMTPDGFDRRPGGPFDAIREDMRAALSIAEEEIERLWREKEEGRRRLVEMAFDEFYAFELDTRKLRAICCGLSSAPPTAEEREWAAGEVKRLGLDIGKDK